MSNQSVDDAGNDDSGGAPSATGLACNGCRRAKLRCSRDRPTCEHCRKTSLDCIYELKRVKPGLKTGAVENLHRRMDTLEQLVLEGGLDQRTTPTCSDHNGNCTGSSHESAAYKILSLLAKELPKLVNAPRASPPREEPHADPRKRRRVVEDDAVVKKPSDTSDCPPLPENSSLEAIITAYFANVQQWIPMVHPSRFQRQYRDPAERPRLAIILQAMTLSATKFVTAENIAFNSSAPAWPSNRVRNWIISSAMDSLTVESLQALTIIAFTDIGDGNAARAWSIVGSLTRTVEYLQLTVEHEDSDRQPCCQPFTSLNTTQNWTILEERRHVFWNIFNLDRFCNTSLGWNTSLTSDDVHRRLPCDGGLWHKENPVVTPYFGIWDKSAGRIGNPIAFIPSHYQSSPGQAGAEAEMQSLPESVSSAGGPPTTDMSTVGAFAYCIEATESMSRVTSYFLQQKINMRDQKEIGCWLTRFKELDLRLVHWKMLLPQKWKSEIARQTTMMDPNLTLAHCTHNASMILLHQLIAYPPASWAFRNRLPSSCSADTCYSAGVEIATITENYLKYTPDASPVTSQFCFCVFVAGRMMLMHWRFYVENRLADEFWSLIRSLQEMSRRWVAFSEEPILDLAAKYALKLKDLYDMCEKDESYRIDVTGYTNEIDHQSKFEQRTETTRQNIRHKAQEPSYLPKEQTHSEVSQWAYGSAAMSGRLSCLDMNTPAPSGGHSLEMAPDSSTTAVTNRMDMSNPSSAGVDTGEFNTIPQMMLDQHFMHMDRIITFDDGSMFAANLEGSVW
ncbi:uncharacterized protein BCR38DRAFT_426110 [Pseudomassariella vexata]|uniref:Zn(2)-C6 fungal-type domain-containing protein n=1 Tax=Pseudomassariella vexata TaxID=1141098 RepID=A0A1Y2E6B3_9PEZI|nr:uncharacterized protein BCR38DRAFT_426110 [Pseudomassariella vexata]ORY67110.1 hypothetical protein BCR38DRAFT_426110 [Pseudomassariella vexata]